MRLRLFAFVLLVPALVCPAQTRRALLIGINLYEPAGTTAQHPAGCAYGRCELGSFDNLDGAVNDAQSMADLLTSPKFGFPADKVALLTNPAPPQPRPGIAMLPAAQTDRDGILAAMQKYLVDQPQKGDTVVFYDASHGSLRVNSKGTQMTVLLDGKYVHADSTLVPSDAYKGGFDVRDREMTRIFNASLDKGVHLTVIFDSCHSGGATRGISRYRARTLPYDPRDVAEPPELLADGRQKPVPSERTDNPALVFSAAQQDQEANEAEPSSALPESHGAFTAALIEALQTLPADTPASVVYQRVKAVLEGSINTATQEPDLDASTARRQQPLFGSSIAATSADAGKLRTAALKTDRDGMVWLDVGRVSGIGVGSEFTSMIKGSGGEKIRLRVTGLEGIARSSAKVVAPMDAKVAAGEVFELAKWVPTESAPLRFWLWPANLSEAEILAAAAQVRLAGVASASDPAEELWTDILCWDGTNWTLQPAGAPAPATPVNLGAKLTASALKQHLSTGAKLWVNLPPSRELAAKLSLHESNSAVQAAPDLTDASYILTGALTGDGPVYAWFHKQEFDAGPRAQLANHTPGCSATSQYPVRSDWLALHDAAAVDAAAGSLNKDASLLAKVHGWLQLADNPTGASSAKYYKLVMVHAADQTSLPSDQAAQQDDRLQMALQASAPVTERRWVYVLDIDCHGKGSLLYPRNATGNQFPSDADHDRQFVLPGSPTLRIGPPYGIDTLVMLSTAQPLPDPSALEFEGVATRGLGGDASPLGKLLADTSRGTRGAPADVPTNWGIDLLTLHSVPRDGAK
jgi:Caspase domain